MIVYVHEVIKQTRVYIPVDEYVWLLNLNLELTVTGGGGARYFLRTGRFNTLFLIEMLLLSLPSSNGFTLLRLVCDVLQIDRHHYCVL